MASQASLLKSNIQTTRASRLALWPTILHLHWTMSLSGHLAQAHDLLSLFLPHLPPSFLPPSSDARTLATLWAHAPAAKPPNIPTTWSTLLKPYSRAEPPSRNIFSPEFYTNWEEKYWLPSYGFAKPEKLDPHAWRTSNDHYECYASARVLCRVPPGEVPSRQNIQEAFDAMKKIRGLAYRKHRWEAGDLSSLPVGFDQVVEVGVYLAFCIGLGEWEEAREVWSGVGEMERLWEYCGWAEIYEVCLAKGGYLGLISREEAERCVEEVREAFGGGRTDGADVPLKVLMGLEWGELLRRFSEAAFKAHRKKYGQLENPPRRAEDILQPPITPEVLVEVEQRLGPLPDDLREMVLVANGFRGLWHEFGGGFPGVDKFEATPCDDDWLKFASDDFQHTDGPSEEAKKAPIWLAFGGTEEGDDWEHIICPPKTWRKLVGDDHPAAGEYRVAYSAHWDVCDGGHASMRDWIATETLEMETLVAKRERGEEAEEEDADEN